MLTSHELTFTTDYLSTADAAIEWITNGDDGVTTSNWLLWNGYGELEDTTTSTELPTTTTAAPITTTASPTTTTPVTTTPSVTTIAPETTTPSSASGIKISFAVLVISYLFVKFMNNN